MGFSRFGSLAIDLVCIALLSGRTTAVAGDGDGPADGGRPAVARIDVGNFTWTGCDLKLIPECERAAGYGRGAGHTKELTGEAGREEFLGFARDVAACEEKKVAANFGLCALEYDAIIFFNIIRCAATGTEGFDFMESGEALGLKPRSPMGLFVEDGFPFSKMGVLNYAYTRDMSGGSAQERCAKVVKEPVESGRIGSNMHHILVSGSYFYGISTNNGTRLGLTMQFSRDDPYVKIRKGKQFRLEVHRPSRQPRGKVELTHLEASKCSDTCSVTDERILMSEPDGRVSDVSGLRRLGLSAAACAKNNHKGDYKACHFDIEAVITMPAFSCDGDSVTKCVGYDLGNSLFNNTGFVLDQPFGLYVNIPLEGIEAVRKQPLGMTFLTGDVGGSELSSAQRCAALFEGKSEDFDMHKIYFSGNRMMELEVDGKKQKFYAVELRKKRAGCVPSIGSIGQILNYGFSRYTFPKDTYFAVRVVRPKSLPHVC